MKIMLCADRGLATILYGRLIAEGLHPAPIDMSGFGTGGYFIDGPAAIDVVEAEVEQARELLIAWGHEPQLL